MIIAVPEGFNNDMKGAADVTILNSKQAVTQLCAEAGFGQGKWTFVRWFIKSIKDQLPWCLAGASIRGMEDFTVWNFTCRICPWKGHSAGSGLGICTSHPLLLRLELEVLGWRKGQSKCTALRSMKS